MKTYVKKIIKVKFTLVQALRLCTGRTAHMRSRGVALPFHDHGTRRGWGVSVTPWPLFTPAKDPVPIIQKAEWAPGQVWTGAENLAPQPGFDPGTVQPVASHYTDWATGPENLSTFMIISHWIILRMRNVSDKFVQKIKNTHLIPYVMFHFCTLNYNILYSKPMNALWWDVFYLRIDIRDSLTVANTTKTYWWLSICNKTHYTKMHSLVYYIYILHIYIQ